jgi:hypothetical protein
MNELALPVVLLTVLAIIALRVVFRAYKDSSCCARCGNPIWWQDHCDDCELYGRNKP